MAEGSSIPASVLKHEWKAGAHESALQCVGVDYWRCKKMPPFLSACTKQLQKATISLARLSVCLSMYVCMHVCMYVCTRVGTLIMATIYLQLIQNRYMFRSFTLKQCSHQHCVQPVASDVEVVGYL